MRLYYTRFSYSEELSQFEIKEYIVFHRLMLRLLVYQSEFALAKAFTQFNGSDKKFSTKAVLGWQVSIGFTANV